MADSDKPGTRHRWLLVLPFIWQAALVPFVNDVDWQPFSLPFPMVWQMTGILLTALVIGVVYSIDRRIEARPDTDRAQ